MTDTALDKRIEEGRNIDADHDKSLGVVFNQEFDSDFWEASRSLNHLYYQRKRGNLPTFADDHSKLSDIEKYWAAVDDVLIKLCGWSFDSLVELTNKRIEEQLEDAGDGDVSTLLSDSIMKKIIESDEISRL